MSEHYYQTTMEIGEVLKKYEAKAGCQSHIILNWFIKNPTEKRSPSQIHRILFTPRTPLTSVRRAMSRLSMEGVENLVKLDDMVDGKYGRPEHQWELNNDISWG